MLFQWAKSIDNPDIWVAEAELPGHKALIKCSLSQSQKWDILEFDCNDIRTGNSICSTVKLMNTAGRCNEVRLAEAETAIKQYFDRIVGVSAELFEG